MVKLVRSKEFAGWFERLAASYREGDEHARRIATHLVDQLRGLEALPGKPVDDSAWLMRVRQSGKNEVWRVSHPFDPQIAVRTIVWFPPGADEAVVLILAADKLPIGDIFYDSVGRRSDQIIRHFELRRRGNENS